MGPPIRILPLGPLILRKKNCILDQKRKKHDPEMKWPSSTLHATLRKLRKINGIISKLQKLIGKGGYLEKLQYVIFFLFQSTP